MKLVSIHDTLLIYVDHACSYVTHFVIHQSLHISWLHRFGSRGEVKPLLSDPFQLKPFPTDCRLMGEKLVPKQKELTFKEISRTVDETSSKLKLIEGSNGLYMIAKSPLKVGELVLSEKPFFEGNVYAKHSQQVYSPAFLTQLEKIQDTDLQEDCFHPRSPLMDCVAAILLCKQVGDENLEAMLKLQKISALHQSPVRSTVDHGECVEDLWGALKPEFQKTTSKEELGYILQILSANRFGQGKHSMHLLFAGSMFQHSCLPNCFLSTWAAEDTQKYRALRDIAEGEVLTIDYLNFPVGYCPVATRAQAFQKWGFTCSCPRCVELPEVERSSFAGENCLFVLFHYSFISLWYSVYWKCP